VVDAIELTNIISRKQKRYMPTTLEGLIKIDMEEYKKKKKKKNEADIVDTKETVNEDGTITTTTTTTTTMVETVIVKKTGKGDTKVAGKGAEMPISTSAKSDVHPERSTNRTAAALAGLSDNSSESDDRDSFCPTPRHDNYGDGDGVPAPIPESKGKVDIPHQSSDSVVVGLRIYTDKDVKCSVLGRLRTGCKDPNCSNCGPPTIVTIPAVTAPT